MFQATKFHLQPRRHVVEGMQVVGSYWAWRAGQQAQPPPHKGGKWSKPGAGGYPIMPRGVKQAAPVCGVASL